MATDLSTRAKDLEAARTAAFVSGDVEAMAGFLDDDLVYIHSNGGLDTKSSLLGLIGGGVLRYKAITPAIEQVSAIGTEGLVAAGILETHAQIGDETKVLRGRYLATWRKNAAGDWKLLALQGSAGVV